MRFYRIKRGTVAVRRQITSSIVSPDEPTVVTFDNLRDANLANLRDSSMVNLRAIGE